jgi:hypothetical protein
MAAGLELFSCSAAVTCETQDEEERKKMAKKRGLQSAGNRRNCRRRVKSRTMKIDVD